MLCLPPGQLYNQVCSRIQRRESRTRLHEPVLGGGGGVWEDPVAANFTLGKAAGMISLQGENMIKEIMLTL